MSTRAVYTFLDGNEEYHVYKHHDGYPTGAAEALNNALALAWPLPRYEADEFAAAFVAANKLPYWMQEQVLNAAAKSGSKKNITLKITPPGYAGAIGGGVRLLHSGSIQDVAPSDIEYRYQITNDDRADLWVKAYGVNNWDDYKEELLFECKLKDMAQVAKARDRELIVEDSVTTEEAP